MQRRLLTARAVLFTYHDASLSFVEHFDGTNVISAKCLPQKALVTNKTLDFSIVAVPASFSTLAGINVPAQKLDKVTVELGETVVLQHNTGDADCGATERIELTVTGVTENELLCQPPPHAKCEITLGCPVYNHRNDLVAMVVRPRGAQGEDGASIRAMRVDALLERLRKRSQSEEALGDCDGAAGDPPPDADDPAAVIRRRRRQPAGISLVRGLALAAVAVLAAAAVAWDIARMRARALAR